VTRAGAPAADDTFGVIAHPLRRAVLERLAAGDSRVTELAAGMPVSRPAVSQHLRLMLDVGVVRERRGRPRALLLVVPRPAGRGRALAGAA